MKKKGQEEIAGFVAIVAIVVIIGFIFLRFSISDEATVKESKDERRFLESTMELTTECAFYEPSYRNVKDLLKDCYSESGKKCLNGKDVCETLNETLNGAIESSYPVGENYKRKGFVYNAVFYRNSTSGDSSQEIISISKGNCTLGIYVGADYPFAVFPGTITSTLRVCY